VHLRAGTSERKPTRVPERDSRGIACLETSDRRPLTLPPASRVSGPGGRGDGCALSPTLPNRGGERTNGDPHPDPLPAGEGMQVDGPAPGPSPAFGTTGLIAPLRVTGDGALWKAVHPESPGAPGYRDDIRGGGGVPSPQPSPGGRGGTGIPSLSPPPSRRLMRSTQAAPVARARIENL
jgi:hypothetical protein